MPTGKQTTQDPLQEISAYFLSDTFKNQASAIQARYPELFSIKRSEERKPSRKLKVKMEHAGINPTIDAAVDKALKSYAQTAKNPDDHPMIHSQYEYPLLRLIDIAFSHHKPHQTGLWLDNDMAARAYQMEGKRLATIRDALVAQPQHESTSTAFLNDVLERLDQFVRLCPATASASKDTTATSIKRKGRPAQKKHLDESDDSPGTREI